MNIAHINMVEIDADEDAAIDLTAHGQQRPAIKWREGSLSNPTALATIRRSIDGTAKARIAELNGGDCTTRWQTLRNHPTIENFGGPGGRGGRLGEMPPSRPEFLRHAHGR